ncbi:hypothetical protein QZH41_012829, partial [Actinostola sp. cb2023]
MWHAYNLIGVGDRLRSTTIRRVQTQSVTGSVSSNKIRTTLTLAVENIEFDTQACVLRVKGRNKEENQFVKMGAYHTIDLELNRKFTLIKEHWDIIALDRVGNNMGLYLYCSVFVFLYLTLFPSIDTACDPTQHADLGAIILHEGLCHLCLVTSSMTIVRAKIDMNVPRKRKGYCAQHDKTTGNLQTVFFQGLLKFYDAIIQAVLRHINFDVVKCVLVGSPGFVKDQYFDYMIQQATKMEWKVLLENKSKFLLVHSSSGHKHALKEILSDSSIASRLADTKASSEVKALDAFYSILQNESDRAYYGICHVERANEALAVETLLVTDKLFRSADLATRKRYVALVENVKDNGGEV